ncbi:Lactonase, 7-bladed beta-propeller-domain-containing protein [Pyrenochaeta sp. MPI-SDFR-AT-0127]|nr:Lactonase, 7-bladed beta-propeller-domain-containing protein [Pyrenochaeta sp. MPI-SDFR-AT-0127]
MPCKILVSGERRDFTTLELDTSKKELLILANYAAPHNASWTDHFSSRGSVDFLIGISESDDSATVYTFQIDHAQQTCQVTSQQPTSAGPCHVLALRDRSAVVVATYEGGSVILYPVSENESGQMLLKNVPRIELFPDFRYKDIGHGPNKNRQTQCRIHQILDDQSGRLYAPDFGSDRVWMFQRNGIDLEICGWLECPPGSGSRHAVICHDQRILYVVGELSHDLIAFDLPIVASENIQPIKGFAANIIPPSVDRNHQSMMESGEVCRHPTIPNVIYISNRWERHIAEREPHLEGVPDIMQSGDTVAIILLAEGGRSVEAVRHVRTHADVIRGMRISNDGKYAAILGQLGGGVEIYEISGNRGEVWTFEAGISQDLGTGLKHPIWL